MARSPGIICPVLLRPIKRDVACAPAVYWQEWTEMLDKDDKIWDQNGFNDLMRRGSRPSPDNKDRLFE